MVHSIRHASVFLLIPAFMALALASPRASGDEISDSDVVQAQNAANSANRDYNQSVQQLAGLIASLQASYQKRPEYVQATSELNGALAASDAAQKKVMAILSIRDDYKTALSASDAAEQAVNDTRDAADDGDGDSDDIFALAKTALAARTVVSKLVTAALSADPDYQAARARLVAAAAAKKNLDDALTLAEQKDEAIESVRSTIPELKTAADNAQISAEQLQNAKAQQDAAAAADQNDLDQTNNEGIFPTPAGRIVNFTLPLPRDRNRDDHRTDNRNDNRKDNHNDDRNSH